MFELVNNKLPKAADSPCLSHSIRNNKLYDSLSWCHGKELLVMKTSCLSINYSKTNCKFVPTLPFRENLIQIYNPKFTIHLRNSQTLVNRFFSSSARNYLATKVERHLKWLIKNRRIIPAVIRSLARQVPFYFGIFVKFFQWARFDGDFCWRSKLAIGVLNHQSVLVDWKKNFWKLEFESFLSFVESSSIELLDFNNLSQVILPDCLESNCECKFTFRLFR